MDAKSRQIIAFHVGDRSHKSAEQLWAKIPPTYRQHATFYTDQYVVYEKVIPAAQHQAISKLARKTNHIERFRNTLRQRVSRLVRDALSFSKILYRTLSPSCSDINIEEVGSSYTLWKERPIQKEHAMSDNLRRYRAIQDALIQCYPGQPSGTVARHLITLA